MQTNTFLYCIIRHTGDVIAPKTIGLLQTHRLGEGTFFHCSITILVIALSKVLATNVQFSDKQDKTVFELGSYEFYKCGKKV